MACDKGCQDYGGITANSTAVVVISDVDETKAITCYPADWV